MFKKLSLGLVFLLLSVQQFVFAEDQTEAAPRDQGMWQTLILLGTAAVFFYFILYRPEQKKRKEMDVLRGSLKKGDKVTAVGIVGIVSRVSEKTVILKMVDGSKIEVLKGAINDVIPGNEEDAKKAD